MTTYPLRQVAGSSSCNAVDGGVTLRFDVGAVETASLLHPVERILTNVTTAATPQRRTIGLNTCDSQSEEPPIYRRS